MTSTGDSPPHGHPQFAAVVAELRRDHQRSNEEIAACVGCSVSLVTRTRRVLLNAGEIARRGSRVEAIIAALEGWDGPNAALAAQFGVDASYISHARRLRRERARVRQIAEGGTRS